MTTLGGDMLGDVKRNEVVQIRLSPEERKRWDAAAARDGLKLSEWLRAAADRAATKRKKTK